MHTKLIIDATTPVPPEKVVRETELLEVPEKTKFWEETLKALIQRKEERR